MVDEAGRTSCICNNVLLDGDDDNGEEDDEVPVPVPACASERDGGARGRPMRNSWLKNASKSIRSRAFLVSILTSRSRSAGDVVDGMLQSSCGHTG